MSNRQKTKQTTIVVTGALRVKNSDNEEKNHYKCTNAHADLYLCYQPNPHRCLSISLLNLFTAANNKGPYQSAQMRMLIRTCIFVISPTPQMRWLVCFLAKPIDCSKRQRSISQCANAHADPYLCYQLSHTDVQACLFLS